MARASAISKKLAKSVSSKNSFNFVWIIIIVALIAIILFAIFYPRRGSGIPESFANCAMMADQDDYSQLMEAPEQGGSSLSDITSSAQPTLVMFYAPWCGFCKQVKPDFEAFRQKLMAEGSQVKAEMIDCTTPEGKKISSKYGVNGFPTFKFFKNGMAGKSVVDCNAPREESGWRSFISSAL